MIIIIVKVVKNHMDIKGVWGKIYIRLDQYTSPVSHNFTYCNILGRGVVK
jgi:hypothetical protein